MLLDSRFVLGLLGESQVRLIVDCLIIIAVINYQNSTIHIGVTNDYFAFSDFALIAQQPTRLPNFLISTVN